MPRLACTTILLLLSGPALGREITVKLTTTDVAKAPYAMTLLAPGATCAAVSEAVNLAVVGQKVEKDAQLTLFRLDDQGNLAGAPTFWKLPKPATLAQRETSPLALAFHPSLPLLYVWQDVKAQGGDPEPPADPAWKDFDHLHIYAVDRLAPELLVSLCRGPRFHTGCVAGSLCVDVAHGKLYVPNLRFGDKNPPESAAVGWFHLDADGLPVAGDDEPAKPATPAKDLTGRAARVAALRTAIAANKPVGAFRHTPPTTYGFHWWPCGAGFIPYSRDVFIACGPFGPVTWNGADRRARAQVFLMPVNFVTYYVTRITGHPTLPVVFASLVGYPYAHRIEHAEGYLTLAPQVVNLEGATLKTPPVVLTRRNLVAFGGPGAVYVAAIDAAGKFKDEKGTLLTVNATSAEGLAYSEKFDRLYIAVEKLK